MHSSLNLGPSGKTWAALVGIAALYACSSEGDSSLFTSISVSATDAVASGRAGHANSGGNGSAVSLTPPGSGGKRNGNIAGAGLGVGGATGSFGGLFWASGGVPGSVSGGVSSNDGPLAAGGSVGGSVPMVGGGGAPGSSSGAGGAPGPSSSGGAGMGGAPGPSSSGGAGGGGAPGPSSSGGAGGGGAVSMCQTGSVDRCDGRDQNCKDGIADEHCPEGCKGVSFGDHGYMFCLYNSNRGEARTLCERNGLYLASIDSALENAWVRATAKGLAIETAWLGARDTAAEGTWLWIDGRQFWQGNAAGAPIGGKYAAWFSAQPNNDGGAQDCLLMRSDGLWEAIECSEPQSGFVCRAD